MARYYFHLRDGQDHLLDPDGREISDAGTIDRLTLSEARSLISQDALSGVIRLDQRIDVEDDEGVLVHRLEFSAAVRIIGRA